MTAVPKAQLVLRANQIRNEMAGGANTAQRVGSLFRDMLDSEQDTQGAAAVAGVITLGPGVSQLVADTEGLTPADDVDTITTGEVQAGHVLVVRSANSARVPTLRHGVGNLWLVGGVNFPLANTSHRIGFMWSGLRWQELWRNTV